MDPEFDYLPAYPPATIPFSNGTKTFALDTAILLRQALPTNPCIFRIAQVHPFRIAHRMDHSMLSVTMLSLVTSAQRRTYLSHIIEQWDVFVTTSSPFLPLVRRSRLIVMVVEMEVLPVMRCRAAIGHKTGCDLFSFPSIPLPTDHNNDVLACCWTCAGRHDALYSVMHGSGKHNVQYVLHCILPCVQTVLAYLSTARSHRDLFCIV